MVRSMRWWKFFPCWKIGNMGITKFSEFYSKNWNYCEFWEPKSICDREPISRVFQFRSIKNYLLLSCSLLDGTCVITLLVPTLIRTKRNIWSLSFRLRFEIAHLTGWGQGVVDNGCFYLIGCKFGVNWSQRGVISEVVLYRQCLRRRGLWEKMCGQGGWSPMRSRISSHNPQRREHCLM